MRARAGIKGIFAIGIEDKNGIQGSFTSFRMTTGRDDDFKRIRDLPLRQAAAGRRARGKLRPGDARDLIRPNGKK
jgi:hypothetical protein